MGVSPLSGNFALLNFQFGLGTIPISQNRDETGSVHTGSIDRFYPFPDPQGPERMQVAPSVHDGGNGGFSSREKKSDLLLAAGRKKKVTSPDDAIWRKEVHSEFARIYRPDPSMKDHLISGLRRASETAVKDKFRSILLKHFPESAGEDDLRWLRAQIERARIQKQDKGIFPFLERILFIAQNHPDPRMRELALSQFKEVTEEEATLLMALKKIPRNLDELWQELERASVDEDPEKIMYLIPLILQNAGERVEIAMRLDSHPDPAVRANCIIYFTAFTSDRKDMKTLWTVHKPLIERDLGSPKARTARQALYELAIFAENNVPEALLWLTRIAEDPSDPVRQEDARLLLNRLRD